MRILLISLAIGGVLAGATVAGASVFAAAPKQVSVKDDYYTPRPITIRKGRTVTWTWRGENPHTVTDTKKRFSSKVKTSGTYSHTFRRRGIFRIYCKVHPFNMRMKITVE